MIQARKEALKNEKSEESTNKITFLDLLLKASANEFQPLTDEELRQEVDTFMFAVNRKTAIRLE